MKACFHKELRKKKQNPKGYLSEGREAEMGSSAEAPAKADNPSLQHRWYYNVYNHNLTMDATMDPESFRDGLRCPALRDDLFRSCGRLSGIFISSSSPPKRFLSEGREAEMGSSAEAPAKADNPSLQHRWCFTMYNHNLTMDATMVIGLKWDQ